MRLGIHYVNTVSLLERKTLRNMTRMQFKICAQMGIAFMRLPRLDATGKGVSQTTFHLTTVPTLFWQRPVCSPV